MKSKISFWVFGVRAYGVSDDLATRESNLNEIWRGL